MKYGYNRDCTIVALATAAGKAPIAVIRVSGPDTFSIVDKIFFGSKKPSKADSHTILYGKLSNSQKFIDEVLVSVFKKPNSFTGEDVVEISCHGNNFIIQDIISLLTSKGANYALPGEFTFRAFINGKLDLAQAEAISELINSNTETAKKKSLDSVLGKLSNKIISLRKQLIDVLGLLELDIDFSEEGLSIITKDKINTILNNIITDIKSLITSYSSGKIFKNGVKVSIIGKTNVGKSSLLNTLLEESRVIVSDVHGTTRDSIEENININGVNFKFVDTAGLRETTDLIEREGIKRSLEHKSTSDIVLHLYDVNDDLAGVRITDNESNSGYIMVNIINKLDLIEDQITSLPQNFIKISCKTHFGIADLKNYLFSVVTKNVDLSESSVMIQTERQLDLFNKSLISLETSLNSLTNGLGNEFIAIDIRLALSTLGEIVGETSSDDILNNIFSNFCIGK